MRQKENKQEIKKIYAEETFNRQEEEAHSFATSIFVSGEEKRRVISFLHLAWRGILPPNTLQFGSIRE